ncbi:MAG: Lrp/AsnC ligand binding domain-containing protein [Desulfurococcales archaeon]|nr:Lrp/AsnC ligand binding domain-containing protein [Desulfurococcales archaeon]
MPGAQAIILIQTDIGMETKVRDKLLKIPEVKAVYIVYGIYDIVTIIEADSLERIRKVILEQIRAMSGIRTTTTMVVVEGKVRSIK